MNTKTGEIRELGDYDQPKKGEIPLSPPEMLALIGVAEKDRPRVLALFHFVNERTALGASCDIRIKNAFARGYLAALKDQGIEK